MTNADIPQPSRCDEIADTPHLITLGKYTIDGTKITARQSMRIWDTVLRARRGELYADDEMFYDVFAIVSAQNPGVEEIDFLEAGNMIELETFIGDVVTYAIRTYKPLLQRHPELFLDAPANQPEK